MLMQYSIWHWNIQFYSSLIEILFNLTMFQFDIEMLIESKFKKKHFRHKKLKTDKIKTEMIFFASVS